MDTRVAISGCLGYEPEEVRAAVKALLAPFGGAEALLKKGKRVLIKPNLLMAASPDRAVTSHPEIIKALAEELVSAGAEVTLADSPGGVYNGGVLKRVYSACGLSELSGLLTLNQDASHRDVRDEELFGRKTVPVIAPVFEADIVISLAKLKTHTLTGITCGVKNLFGVIPGTFKAGYHAALPNVNDFAGFLVSLAEYVKPGFTLIDGVIGMEGNGPSGGRAKRANVLIGAINPHAADLAASQIMGFEAGSLPTLNCAMSRGLICREASELELSGEDIEKYIAGFDPPQSYKSAGTGFSRTPRFVERILNTINKKYPVVTDKCIGCGDCARNCPQKTIDITDKKARINYKNCICCYCCQELCPINAITLGRKE